MPRLGSGTRRQGRARVCVILFKEKAFAQQSIRRPWGPPQDLTRIVPVAIEICSAKGNPTGPRQKWFTATLVTSEGRKGLVGQPARHQGGRKGPDQLEAPGRQERTNWTSWEAPERQERTNWTAGEAPGRQERTNWTAGKDQLDSWGGTREAGKD